MALRSFFKSNIGTVYFTMKSIYQRSLTRNYINTETKTLEREMTKRNWQTVEINIPGNRAILRILPSPYLVLRAICILHRGDIKANVAETREKTERDRTIRVGTISHTCNYEASSLNVHASMRHAKNLYDRCESA